MGLTERLAIIVDAKTGGAISELNKLNAEVNAVNRTQVEATGTAGMLEKGLGKLGIESNNAGALLKAGVAAGAATAGYAMLNFGKDSVKAATDWADSVRNVERATGQTAENSSRLAAIMDDFGISTESGAKAFGKLGRSINENQDALKQYGVDVVRSKDGSVDMQKTLGNVAEAYSRMRDPAEKAALVNDAFGKTGRDLIPILEQGRSGIEKMYAAVPDKQILSQEQLDNAQAYKLAMDNLNDVMMEVKVTIGNALIPTLTDLFNGIANVSRAFTSLDSMIPGFSSHVMNAGLMMNPLTPASSCGARRWAAPRATWKSSWERWTSRPWRSWLRTSSGTRRWINSSKKSLRFRARTQTSSTRFNWKNRRTRRSRKAST